MSRCVFSTHRDPLVSVVVVTYGNWPWVERALHALHAHTPEPYELILVDNASPDDTVERLASGFDGLTLVTNEENRGFSLAANQGAARAVGRYLCFLNNDAEVQPGWLTPMVDRLDRVGDVRAVVPMLLNLDGSVQDAGGLVGREGSVIVYGRDADPSEGAFGFPRRVDYGSAACALVRRRDFHAVGGFDPMYGTGYFEDVDLCFALEALGGHVVYEPAARVVHVGGLSTDAAQRQVLFEQNHARFQDRWEEALIGRVPFVRSDYYDHRPLAARDWSCHDRLLVVADGPSGARLVDPVLAALRSWTDARVTLALGDAASDAADRWRRAGVEVVGAAAPPWLEARRYHYSVVLADEPAAERLGPLLNETQPQAVRAIATAGSSTTRPAPADWPILAVSATDPGMVGWLADRGLLTTARPN
ncbi:MAG TPA: glycosyltransferase family 2 protein [Acidimicrobiia bacterium]|nr:glycosyltransferase family 2 protein [Acidimicrobiia bacterium]